MYKKYLCDLKNDKYWAAYGTTTASPFVNKIIHSLSAILFGYFRALAECGTGVECDEY